METIVVRLDPEIRDLVPDFLENRRRDVEALRIAIEHGDFGELARLGHLLKGVGGGFGFDDISVFGQTIELAARERRLDQARQGLESLGSYLKRVRVVFDAESR